jgi:hypothetical protein
MSEHDGRMFDLDNRDKPGIPVNASKFPALISTAGTLKILDHHELPVGQSFTVLAIAPLTPQSVLTACLQWTQQQVQIAINDQYDGD